jgi:hypothetical protein
VMTKGVRRRNIRCSDGVRDRSGSDTGVGDGNVSE